MMGRWTPLVVLLVAFASNSLWQWHRVGLLDRIASNNEACDSGGDCLPGQKGHASQTPARDIDGTYIVRFNDFQSIHRHRHRLHKALQHTSGWSWIERSNPAMQYPTDFALIKLQQGVSADAFTSTLSSLAFVKDLHPERILRLAPLKAADTNENEWQQFSKCSSSSKKKSGSMHSNQEDDELCVRKRPGRLTTRPTFSLDDNVDDFAADSDSLHYQKSIHNGTTSALSRNQRRRLLQGGGHNLADVLQARKVWEQGHKGENVKVGIFDTGIKGDHPDVKNIRERTNWTHEPTLEDKLGHGSFVAGVVAGHNENCPGLAPEVELYTFRVFTNDQVSFTSWFLDAFNYAIATDMNIVNLSIGGPDYLDQPFVEKVLEVTSRGIIMISAIGNDGPLYGTLNNPADQNDVIGIGGIDYNDRIAPFSSRGMSTWELPIGYGRIKPDIVTYGRDVQGSRIGGGCRALSGTSVASPVVAGAVCLLASTVPEEKRWKILNPGSMKQALVEGAARVNDAIVYEQGSGKLDVLASMKILAEYKPRASIVPSTLDLTDCPYMWPFCRQPIYAHGQPLIFNATVLNGMGVVGRFVGEPQWDPSDDGGKLLDVQFDYFEQLWPWSGHLALFISVKPEGDNFNGTASGDVTFVIESPPALGETSPRRSTVSMSIKAYIIATPPRAQRVLWDQFHSIRYPPAYFPRDDLSVRHDILDWHGDHPHTNFHDMYDRLRDAGYYLEILASPYTCFDAKQYGALLVVDSEDEFYPEEIEKLHADIKDKGLALLVFADWYCVDTMRTLRFFDDNTRSWWDAATGGANVPALNDLLKPMGAALEGGAFDGDVKFPGHEFKMLSGSALAAWPAGGYVYNATFKRPKKAAELNAVDTPDAGVPILGLTNVGSGKLLVYGDSNCLDSSHRKSDCYNFLLAALRWAVENGTELLADTNKLTQQYGSFADIPERRSDYNFTEASLVLQTPLQCFMNAPMAYRPKRSIKATEDKQGIELDIDGKSSVNINREMAQQDAPDKKDDDDSFSNLSDRDSPNVKKSEEDDESSGDRWSAFSKDQQHQGDSAKSTGGPMMWFFESQFSQSFTVLGAVGIVALWSRSRRRRQRSTSGSLEHTPMSPYRSGNGRSPFTLPVFTRWQHPRVRAE